MSSTIDFLSGLYNRHSCYADRLTEEQLALIHVQTSLEPALVKWIQSKKDVVLTGNPGDGKTFLIRRLAEVIKKAKGDYILDATAERSYADIVARWQQARNKNRPFVLAINHGPLRQLLSKHAGQTDFVREASQQVESLLYYGSDPPKPPKQTIVIDLNLRSVLSRSVVEACLDNLMRDAHHGDLTEYFQDPVSDGYRNIQALRHPQVRERLFRILTTTAHGGRHVSMRDLLGFLSFLLFAGRATNELQKDEPNLKGRYFNCCFEGEGELFEAIRDTFDPVLATLPSVDEQLWENTGVQTNWLFGRPRITPDHYPDAWDLFRALKRQYYFEHENGARLLDLQSPDDTAYEELLSNGGEDGRRHMGSVIKALNRFYCQSLPDDDQYLRLWARHVYDGRTPSVLVSVYRIAREKFSLEVPRLVPWLCAAFDYEPDHILLRFNGDDGAPTLRIDRSLWRALMEAKRGMPMSLRSPQHAQVLEHFVTRIRRLCAAPSKTEMVMLLNAPQGRRHNVGVDTEKGRFVNP